MRTIKTTVTISIDDFAADVGFLVPTLWSAIEVGLKERGVSNAKVLTIRDPEIAESE